MTGRKVTSDHKAWHPADIMAAVRKRGSSLRRLGVDHGFNPDTFRKALTKQMPGAHQVISRFIGIPVHQLWPQFYGPSGEKRFPAREDVQHRWVIHRRIREAA